MLKRLKDVPRLRRPEVAAPVGGELLKQASWHREQSCLRPWVWGMSWRAGECLSGSKARSTRQAPWHSAFPEFRLEDAAFETPLGSDASQFPPGLEPRKTWVQACPSLPPGLAPRKLGPGSVAREPNILTLAGRDGRG